MSSKKHKIRNFLNNYVDVSRKGFAENSLKGVLDQIHSDRGRFDALRSKEIAGVDSQAARESHRFGASLSSQMASQFAAPPTSFAGAIGDAVKKSKVRSLIQARGDNAIKNQQLADRIRLGKIGVARRGQAAQTLADAQSIRAGLNLQSRQISDAAAADRASAIGGLAGVAGGFIKNWFNNKNAPIGEIGVTPLARTYFPGQT